MPTGYRITHVFQVADEEEELYQYVETTDVDSWEHVTPATNVMKTRTRSGIWTVSISVAQVNMPKGATIDGKFAGMPRRCPRPRLAVNQTRAT